MKTQIITLVEDYRRCEGKIKRLKKLSKDREIAVYFLNGFGGDDCDDDIGSEEWESKAERKRIRDFLKNEIKIEKENLRKIEIEIYKQFKSSKEK